MTTKTQLTLIKHLTWLLAISIICTLIYLLSQASTWGRISLKCKMPKDTYLEFKVEKDQAVKKSE